MAKYAEISKRFKNVLGMKNSPIAVYYSDKKPKGAVGFKGVRSGWCVISLAYKAALGKTAAIDKKTYGCRGAGRYLGFIRGDWPWLPYFLSYGIKGEMEGERYIKTPEIAKLRFDRMKLRPAPARYCIFAPLEKLGKGVDPEVVVFFAPPDIISALVVLAEYANPREESNILVKFGAGCGQVVAIPVNELEKKHPKAVLGLFDVSARPRVPKNILSFAIPLPLLEEMYSNIDGSFLYTKSWKKVYKRIVAGRNVTKGSE